MFTLVVIQKAFFPACSRLACLSVVKIPNNALENLKFGEAKEVPPTSRCFKNAG